MAFPPEVQQLLNLVERRAQLIQRTEALRAETAALNAEFGALWDTGALGVTEARPIRLVHLRTQAGKVRVLKIKWVALINGRNVADAEVEEIDEVQGGRP